MTVVLLSTGESETRLFISLTRGRTSILREINTFCRKLPILVDVPDNRHDSTNFMVRNGFQSDPNEQRRPVDYCLLLSFYVNGA